MPEALSYGTYAPPASVCADCRKEIRSGYYALRTDDPASTAPVYRHMACAKPETAAVHPSGIKRRLYRGGYR